MFKKNMDFRDTSQANLDRLRGENGSRFRIMVEADQVEYQGQLMQNRWGEYRWTHPQLNDVGMPTTREQLEEVLSRVRSPS